MTGLQKIIKYMAMAFAIYLSVAIIGGILGTVGLVGAFFDGSNVTENVKTYDITPQIFYLNIRIHAADL